LNGMYECVDGRINELNGRMDGLDGWKNEWVDLCLDEWMNKWMDG